jgi:hypothetical protein
VSEAPCQLRGSELGTVKYGDTGVRRRSTECTRRQITRTVASTYVLRPRKLLVQYFGGPEYKSGDQGSRRTGGVPDVQVDKEFNELRKDVEDRNNT